MTYDEWKARDPDVYDPDAFEPDPNSEPKERDELEVWAEMIRDLATEFCRTGTFEVFERMEKMVANPPWVPDRN